MLSLFIFTGLLLLSGLAGAELLRRLGLQEVEAWALGRVCGPALVVFPAWWVGSLGAGRWMAVWAVTLLLSSLPAAFFFLRRRAWKNIWSAELVFWSFTAVFLFLRAGRPAIRETEKFMDLGILADLLRTRVFPPPDFWLAHMDLPYYYWGALPWAAPLRVSGLDVGVAYNLIVALAAGMTALVLWTLGRRLGGSNRAGWMAAGLGLLAGTPDGFRQVLAGIHPTNLDLWASSRQIQGAITEFPLFTFWLGDLHPHLLSMPMALAAITMAAIAGQRRDFHLLPLTALFFGLSWAANPWSMPPTLAAIALMLIFSRGEKDEAPLKLKNRILRIIFTAVGGALAFLPFHLHFHPASHSVKAVMAWTRPLDLLLYGGVFLVVIGVAATRIAFRWGGEDQRKTWAWIILTAAGALLLGASTGRPLVVLLSLPIAVFMARLMEAECSEERPALALALLALGLLLVPELFYLSDGYGLEFHRMNTIFKAYIQAWPLLALAFPVLLRLASPKKLMRSLILAGVLILSLPHPISLVIRSLGEMNEFGLDGLKWMPDRDRELLDQLKSLPPGTSLIEAVGGAYSEYGRMSAASGIPAYLGWANHEMVWRGPEINPETARRKQLINSLYTSDTPEEVREFARKAGVQVLVFGELEYRDFGEDARRILRQSGDHELECPGGGLLIFFDRENTE